jgi:two-component system nitrate/nitrite response regulator NarL
MTDHDESRPQTRVFLADDHPVYLRGLRRVIEAQTELSVVGEASDGRGAVAAIRDLRPDVAVLDIRMPGLSGVEVARALQQDPDATRVLLLSGSENVESLYVALAAGASGYLLKTMPAEDICTAIAAVARGEFVFSPELHAALALEIRNREADGAAPLLSTRELEVVGLTAAGGAAADIAAQLFLSVPTVRTHLQTAYQKLGVSDRAAAVAEALRRGLID